MGTLENRKITDLVDNNYIYASVLFYFGIEFYNYSEQTLEQVCHNKGLDVKSVVSKLENMHQTDDAISIDEYPIDLIIEYLKHTHFLFIKQKLPYISKIIADLPDCYEGYCAVVKDLKFVFPLFVEDFIHHIYQEEDTLFSYISNLKAFQKGKGNIARLYFEMEKNSLSRFASEHEEHDDEMHGIRQITNDYSMTAATPLHIKVIFEELKSLENDLRTHARVENDILFPKALMLEREVVAQIKTKIRLN